MVVELESTKNKVANEKFAKLYNRVKMENVKEETGSHSEISTEQSHTTKQTQIKVEISGQTMPGQVMPGQTMQGQTVADQAVPGQTMPMPGQIPVVNQTMPSQIMSGVTMPSQTMAGMTMAGQTTTGHNAVDGANNQWQQGMFMPPGMMPMPQLPPPPPTRYVSTHDSMDAILWDAIHDAPILYKLPTRIRYEPVAAR